VNNSFSFGINTSFKLVMPPKAKNRTNTNARKPPDESAGDRASCFSFGRVETL